MRPRPWLLVAVVAAIGFFVLGLSESAYDLFSPPALTWHVALRKLESVLAFFAVGYALDRAVLEGSRRLAAGLGAASVASYSAGLELAQWLHGSHEGLGWNAVDVACGALGGAIADYTISLQRKHAAAHRAARRRP